MGGKCVGVPASLCLSQALLITYWQCSSIVAIFTVLGANSVQATAVLNLIFASMSAGQLRGLLAITAVLRNPAPFPLAITVTSTYARPYYHMNPHHILVSYAPSSPLPFLDSLFICPLSLFAPLQFFAGAATRRCSRCSACWSSPSPW